MEPTEESRAESTAVEELHAAVADMLRPGSEIRTLGVNALQEVVKSLVPMQPAIEQWLTALGTGVQAVVSALTARWPDIKQALETFPKIEQRLKLLPNEAREAFAAAAFPPCSRLSLAEIDQIAKTFVAEGAAATKMVIAEMCASILTDSAQGEAMLRDWEANPLLAARFDIVREAFQASCSGMHRVAIPAFLAQLEGLVADTRTHAGQMRTRAYKAQVKQMSDSDEFFGPHFDEFFEKTVMATFDHGDGLNSDLSRHAILHGGDTKYGTPHNAIRIILFFDYVQDLARGLQPIAP